VRGSLGDGSLFIGWMDVGMLGVLALMGHLHCSRFPRSCRHQPGSCLVSNCQLEEAVGSFGMMVHTDHQCYSTMTIDNSKGVVID
jgi:hypothetical protein